MQFDDFLVSLGLDQRFDLTEAIETGACSLQFDNELTINIEHDKDKGATHAYCLLSNAPATHRDAFFAMLLQAHLFGTATDDCTFGFEPQRDQVILFKNIALAQLDRHSAFAQLESLVQQAWRWRAYFPHLIEDWEQTVVQAAVNVAQAMSSHTLARHI